MNKYEQTNSNYITNDFLDMTKSFSFYFEFLVFSQDHFIFTKFISLPGDTNQDTTTHKHVTLSSLAFAENFSDKTKESKGYCHTVCKCSQEEIISTDKMIFALRSFCVSIKLAIIINMVTTYFETYRCTLKFTI